MSEAHTPAHVEADHLAALPLAAAVTTVTQPNLTQQAFIAEYTPNDPELLLRRFLEQHATGASTRTLEDLLLQQALTQVLSELAESRQRNIAFEGQVRQLETQLSHNQGPGFWTWILGRTQHAAPPPPPPMPIGWRPTQRRMQAAAPEAPSSPSGRKVKVPKDPRQKPPTQKELEEVKLQRGREHKPEVQPTADAPGTELFNLIKARMQQMRPSLCDDTEAGEAAARMVQSMVASGIHSKAELQQACEAVATAALVAQEQLETIGTPEEDRRAPSATSSTTTDGTGQ